MKIHNQATDSNPSEMCFDLQWKVKQQKGYKTFTKGEGSELQLISGLFV